MMQDHRDTAAAPDLAALLQRIPASAVWQMETLKEA